MQAVNKEIGLDQYWLIIKRRWLPAIAIFGATVAGFSYWGQVQTPIYEAQGRLRIRSSDTTAALTGLDDERGQLNSLNDEESPLETEAELIMMTPLAEETIERLNYRDDEGELISAGEFKDNLDVDSEGGTDILNVSYRSPNPELSEAVVDTLMEVYLEQNLSDNRAEAIAAREFIEEQLPEAERRALRAGAALRDFKERNRIIELETETQETVSAISDITEKITDVSARLYETEARYQRAAERLGADPQAAILAAEVSQSPGVQQILAEYQEVESVLAAERVRFQAQHPVIQDLRAKLNNLNGVLENRIFAVTGAQSLPATANLQSGDLAIGLVSNYLRLESELIGLRQTTAALLDAEEAYTFRGNLLPQLEHEQRELQRQLEAAQSTYASLLQRLQEIRVFENKNVGNASIVQPAEDLGIVAPDQDKYFTTGVMLGTFLALALALLLEAKDQSIKTVQEARECFDRPVLGVIPDLNEISRGLRREFKLPVLGTIPGLSLPNFNSTPAPVAYRVLDDREIPRLVTAEAHTSLATESFHILRNNLKFLNSDNPPKVIAVTSTGPNEGKSTVASNLAASIAKTGQQVLLIDADLHRPIQHWVWDVAGRYGLSDFLVNRISISDAIMPVQPNLNLLLAGSLPPDPASLLDSKKMITLLESMRAQYDYVILDAPSLRSVATTSILGKMMDGLLLVVRPGVANRQSVNYAQELIRQSQQNILGLVMNATLSRYEPYSYFLSEDFYGEVTMSERSEMEVISQSYR